VNLYVFYLPNYKASHPSALYCCVSAVVRPPVLIAVRLLFCAGRKFEVVPLAWRKTITCHWCSIVKYSTSQLTNTKLFFFSLSSFSVTVDLVFISMILGSYLDRGTGGS